MKMLKPEIEFTEFDVEDIVTSSVDVKYLYNPNPTPASSLDVEDTDPANDKGYGQAEWSNDLLQ